MQVPAPWQPGYHLHHRPRSLCTASLSRLCTSELHWQTCPLTTSSVGGRAAGRDALMQPRAASCGLHSGCRRREPTAASLTLHSQGNTILSPRQTQVPSRSTWQSLRVEGLTGNTRGEAWKHGDSPSVGSEEQGSCQSLGVRKPSKARAAHTHPAPLHTRVEEKGLPSLGPSSSASGPPCMNLMDLPQPRACLPLWA